MKPNRTFPSVPNDLREWTRYLAGLFFAREFTISLTGLLVTASATARYTVSAGIVCLSIPDLSGTSNSVNTFLNGLPDDITPSHDQFCFCRVTDNGVTAAGLVRIGLDSSLTVTKDLTGAFGTFTAAGTKGVGFSNLIYPLD